MGFLDWSNTFNTVTQTLTTVIGRTYTISYFVAGTNPNFLEVTFGGAGKFSSLQALSPGHCFVDHE